MRFLTKFVVLCLAASFWHLFGLPTLVAQQKTAPVRLSAVHGLLLSPSKAGLNSLELGGSPVQPDELLIALFGAEFDSPTGGMSARVVADIGQRGPLPALEAAIRFHTPNAVDLDFSLERGILVLTNTKKTGAALAKFRLRGEVFDIKLSEPKARLGIEVYGRLTPGPVLLDDPKTDHTVAVAVFFALEGEVVVTTAKETNRLHSPPGASLLLWDHVSRTSEVVRFETLPDFAKPMSADELVKFKAVCAVAKDWGIQRAKISAAMAQATSSNSELQRKAAVVALGAVDELPRVLDALNDKDHADTRAMAILVLRNWLGREAGQSAHLYDYLTKSEKYTPIQARNLLYMLKGIEPEKRRQPETFSLLIPALNHNKLAMRELAHWHLVRLAPAGRSIAYDAGADETRRLAAIAAWRKLIPEGQLPPPTKPK